MGNNGIGSLTKSQVNQINRLAGKKNSDKLILVAKLKGKKIKFSAETPKVSSKSKQPKPVQGSDIAVKTLGLKDREVSPALAQQIINVWKASEETHVSLPDLQFLKEHLDKSESTTPPGLGSSTSLDSGIGSSASGSSTVLDSLDAEGEPIFGTFQPTPHSSKNGSTFSSASSVDAATAPGLQMNAGDPEITFAPAGEIELPPDYPAPPPPLPPKGAPTPPPKPSKKGSGSQLTPLKELTRLHKAYGVNIRGIKIGGSTVGYIFSNPRNKGEPRPTTLLVEAHGGGYYANGQKIPTFTTPANTRFLMSARRNQTFEVAPWKQADALSRGQVNFCHDDQIYGSTNQGSGVSMTNYHLSPITKEQGDTYDLNLEKTAQLMHYFKESANTDGRINNFNMFMLDPNFTGHVSTENLMTAFNNQDIHYKDIVMNVCRPQQKGKVAMTKVIDNLKQAQKNRISMMGPRRK